METASVGIAARRISESELQNLYKLCANMETRKNENIRSRYDRMFHYAIAAASGNPLISTMLNAASSLIEAQIVDVRAQMLKDSDNLDKINAQHRVFWRPWRLATLFWPPRP
jgi:GntR family transcriptional repressor for pyruvate dehydrogenase complex